VPLSPRIHDGTVPFGDGTTTPSQQRWLHPLRAGGAVVLPAEERAVHPQPHSLLLEPDPAVALAAVGECNIISFEPGTPNSQKWMQVQAMRFLSHAATCLTGMVPDHRAGAESQ
jgi:hypothetical protein